MYDKKHTYIFPSKWGTLVASSNQKQLQLDEVSITKPSVLVIMYTQIAKKV